MAWRYHGRARVDPANPVSFAVCDRCGIWHNITDLHWQYQWAGNVLQNLKLLVCDRCLDVPQPQLKTRILPPDPTPTLNARPENFIVDEIDWMTTQDDAILITQDGEDLIEQNEANNRNEA